jgi:cellulose biosynthesis protein BcsQ
MTMASFVTFYSYKGGAGRTLALANVAVLLAQWGHRVLCVDWDLEAPGLHHYFRNLLPDADGRPGLLELAIAIASGKKPAPKRFVTPTSLRGLDLVCASRAGGKGRAEAPVPDWSLWYRRGFGEALEEVREAWAASYDFVLIDSRTGITDAGGICTVQMPDILVLLTTASEQGLEGTADVAARAQAARKRLAFDRAALHMLPVLARFDQRVESAIAGTYLRRFAERLGPLCRSWLPDSVDTLEIAKLTKIPYVPNWSFGERLPVIEEGTQDPESIGFSLETLAALLARGLGDADLLARSRDAYVASARSARAAARAQQGAFAYDAFLSQAPARVEAATRIAKRLEKEGLRVFFDPRGQSAADERERALRGARTLVFVADGELRGAELEDAASFLKTADPALQRVIVTGARGDLPPLLGDALVVDLERSPAERIAVAARTPSREGDPHFGAFGGMSSRDGWTLDATVTPLPEGLRVRLRAWSKRPSRPSAAPPVARFHLHPMLPAPVREIATKDGAAELELVLPMAFTVGAEIGSTPLELDLATLSK